MSRQAHLPKQAAGRQVSHGGQKRPEEKREGQPPACPRFPRSQVVLGNALATATSLPSFPRRVHAFLFPPINVFISQIDVSLRSFSLCFAPSRRSGVG